MTAEVLAFARLQSRPEMQNVVADGTAMRTLLRQALDDRDHHEHLAVGAKRDRDAAAACLAELLDAIAEHVGARPIDPAQSLRDILAKQAADSAADDAHERVATARACEHQGELIQDLCNRNAWAKSMLAPYCGGPVPDHWSLDDVIVRLISVLQSDQAPIREADVERIAGMCGIPRSPADEPAIAWLERAVRWGAEQRLRRESHERDDQHLERLRRPRSAHDRRPRIFTFANGCEIDVDRYLALDTTATRDGGARPSITFQLGHGGFLRVVFESDQQRADELARMRAFRDGAA